jgi:hypothetical protein
MSHKKIREDKNCLNCGTWVEDRFCTHCGQENVAVKDTAIHMVVHYIQDLFHYDGKFWHTMRNLLLKPGEVPTEYLEGKRARNLDPIKYYVFASTFFFLVLFYLTGKDALSIQSDPRYNYSKRMYDLRQEKEFVAGTNDTFLVNQLIASLQHTIDSAEALDVDTNAQNLTVDVFPGDFDTMPQTWLGRMILKRAQEKGKEMETLHEGDENKAASNFLNELYHKLPQLLFLSMPFFALFLKLLYFRSERKLYAEHFVFSLYQYSYLYCILGAYMLFNYGFSNLAEGYQYVAGYVTVAFIIYMFIYLAFAMKRFYIDRWIMVIIRYSILMMLTTITFFVLFVVMLLITYLI